MAQSIVFAIRANKGSVLLGADLPPPSNVPTVFLQCPRKDMPTGAVGDKEEILGLKGIENRFERGTTRVCDGSGRQTTDPVGVERRVDGEIVSRQPTTQRAFPPSQGIDHRRIRLQSHPATQPIDEDPSDMGSFFGDPGLFFDNGRKDHRLGGSVERQVRRAGRPRSSRSSAIARCIRPTTSARASP